MTPAVWQSATCLPVVMCEGCEDVAQARDYLCEGCRGELNALVAEDAKLTHKDRQVERFFSAIRRVAG